jgi:GT2 family glycosyltransferase
VPDFSVVILSKRPENCIRCVESIFEHEPNLPRERIIVVNDGAKDGAEERLPGITWLEGVKPFGFPRNANIGLRAVPHDVILCNDDAELQTDNGFTELAREATEREDVGLLSAGIAGFVCNRNQASVAAARFRREHCMVAFICVYIPRRTIDKVGLLDERFNTGYGCDDSDYSKRTLLSGLKIGIWDGCVVKHDPKLSTYRARPDWDDIYTRNRQLYFDKWRR